MPETSPTLMAKAQRNEPSEEAFVITRAPDLAATLTSSGNAKSRPTRQQEDDVNLVVSAPDVSATLKANRGSGGGDLGPEETLVSAFSITPEGGQGADLRACEVDTAPAIGNITQGKGTDRGVRIVDAVRVRRLTPVECERLMGWPDGWTAPPGVKAPDSKRYAACGDGVVSHVSEWIGRRMLEESA